MNCVIKFRIVTFHHSYQLAVSTRGKQPEAATVFFQYVYSGGLRSLIPCLCLCSPRKCC